MPTPDRIAYLRAESYPSDMTEEDAERYLARLSLLLFWVCHRCKSPEPLFYESVPAKEMRAVPIIRCTACNTRRTLRRFTPFSNSTMSALKCVQAIRAHFKGATAAELEPLLGISRASAYRLHARIKTMQAAIKARNAAKRAAPTPPSPA